MIRSTRPSMHRSVRITEHVILKNSPYPRRVLMTKAQHVIADWKCVDWALLIAGLKATHKIIAVGCEEGAMMVHFA